MKLNRIALAVAAALAMGSAHADLPNGSVVETTVNNAQSRVVFISGASAVKAGFSAIIATLLTPASTYWFAEGPKSDYLAVAGKLIADAGTGPSKWAAGSDVIIIYRTEGGSVWGVNPVASPPGSSGGQLIKSLDVRDASCGASGAGTFASPYICTTNTRKPDAGVSDVAPELFKYPFNTEGEIPAAQLTAAELSPTNMVSTAIYGLAFGVPVTNNVPLTTTFNRATVSAIMTGNVGTWDQVDSTLTGDIVICRRVPGSGTQAVENLWGGNFPCSDTLYNAPADRDASGAWNDATNTFTVAAGTGGLTVIENSTSGDVATCLDKAVTGGSYTTKDRDGTAVTVNFTAAGNKAIGVLSMDSLSKSKTNGAGGKWQFRSLDGAGGTITWDNTAVAPVAAGAGKLPTLEAYERGDWEKQGWISFNVPARSTGPTKVGLEGLLKDFLVNAQNPAILASIPALKYVAAAIPDSGVYTGSQVLDATYLNGKQCGPYNRNFND